MGFGAVFALVMVPVQRFSGGHDGIVVLLGSGNSTIHAPPTHHRGFGCQSAFQNFIPANDASTVNSIARFGIDIPARILQILFDALYEVALQFMLVFEAIVFHALLAFGTVFPAFFRTFIATDVDVGRVGESAHRFLQNVLQKGEGGFVSGAKYIVEHPPTFCHFKRSACATQFGVSGERRECMSGHFNFGDHRDAMIEVAELRKSLEEFLDVIPLVGN